VIDRLLQALIALAPQTNFSVIPLHNPRRGADAQIFRGSARDLESRAAGPVQLTAACEALAALPDVAAVSTRADSLTVRFADTAIAQVGARLEAGEEGMLDARDLLGGAEVLVNFCDANPTKALHIGHLRNIALGQALAGALAAAGARVTRQSQVSDYCRSMGEALAGYMELPEHTTPRSLGVKSDHFVGECFGRYATRLADGAGMPTDRAPDPTRRPGTEDHALQPGRTAALPQTAEGTDDPALSAEAAVRNDLADKLLERMSTGDPEIVERWQQLRGWALAGQEETLAALGVRLDRLVYESDSRPLTQWILDRGVAGAVLTRTESGAVVYETREAEYPRLLLARADGFPTQHLRTIALWRSLHETLEEIRTIELVGEEWQAYVRYHERMMHGERSAPTDADDPPDAGGHPPSAELPRRERRRPMHHPSSNVIYGMVTVAGDAVKSSNGRPPLVDGMLERLAASPALKELAARSEGRFGARSLAALVTLGFYLGRPTRKPVDLTLTEMLELTGGVGWELARAVVSAWDPRHDGPPDPAPEDAEYRHAVMQSEVHRRLLARAVEQLDVYELARFYGHLSRRHLASDADARTARAMRTLLAAGIGALGLPCAVPEVDGVR
jgi:tRNA synthetases class I (R)